MAGINQGYAKEMADINQQHNKDMFDYTGYQAQVAQMKAAGLNPALMYGSAGGGGSTQGGAGMAGVDFSSIQKVCVGKRGSAGGYKWVYD